MVSLLKNIQAWRQHRPANQARLLERAVRACSDHGLGSLENCLDEGLGINAVPVQGSHTRPQSLLALTAEWEFEEGLVLLLSKGAEPNGGPPSAKYGQTPLQVLLGNTIGEENLRMGRRLVEAGARLEPEATYSIPAVTGLGYRSPKAWRIVLETNRMPGRPW